MATKQPPLFLPRHKGLTWQARRTRRTRYLAMSSDICTRFSVGLLASEYHHHHASRRDPSAKSPHFKFSFLHCAPQFESDMPPYSRAPCRYTSTYTTGRPIDSRERKERIRWRGVLNIMYKLMSRNLSLSSVWNAVCDGVVPFSRVAYLSGPPSVRSESSAQRERRNEYAMRSPPPARSLAR